MVGGANYHKNQFNLATQGERQPGSSFKPFVLATALKENIAPSSILTSSKQVTINADGRQWQVNNYEGEALGPINLSQAIAYSDNSVFSQLTAIVGPRNVAATAHQLGITSKLAGYFAIGLGAEPATPLEMARAYASFADGGKRIDGSIFGNQPRAVDTIHVGTSSSPTSPSRTDVLPTDQAATVNALLQGVVQYGTGKAAALPGLAGGRQDRDNRGLRRRLVRRVHPSARRGCVGRLPGQARSDDVPVPRAPGCGRDVSGAHLEGVHGEGAPVPEVPTGVVHAGSVAVRLGGYRRESRRHPSARRRRLQEHVSARVLRR